MNLTYQQRYIAYSLGLAVLVLLWYFAFYNLQGKKISEMKAGIEKINRDLNTAQSSAGGMKKIKEEIDAIKNEIEQMKEKIPSKDRLLFVYRAIESRGKQYGLRYKQITPKKDILFSKEEGAGTITKVPIDILMTGKFFELGKFIESLNDFPFLVNAGSVTISAEEGYPELEIYLVVYVYLYG